MSIPLSERFGDYALLEALGTGVRGTLYKARPLTPEALEKAGGRERVVIRLLRPLSRDEAWHQRMTARFAQLRALDHPGIARYFDCFTETDRRGQACYGLVMEYLEGETLAEWIERQPRGLPWPEVKNLFGEVLTLLIDTRDKGLIHGDIRPSNIWLTHEGDVRLIDFEPARPAEGLLRPAAEARCPYDFLAPEFSHDPGGPAEETSDIFTLGVGFYAALTGRLPFPALEGDAETAWRERWQDPLAGESPPFERIFRVLSGAKAFVARSLKADPQDRFQRFEEMHRALADIHSRVIAHDYAGTRILLDDWIGHGSLGDVLLGVWTDNEGHHVPVAVKQLPGTPAGERLRRDLRSLMRQPHPHVVACVDILETSGAGGENQHYLALEYFPDWPASSLRARLRGGRVIPPAEAVALFDAYLQALSHLHQLDPAVPHRNIKPENLYAPVGRPEDARIMEPGPARDVREVRLTGWTPETLNYMPPEIAREGSERAGPASDLYALGLCLYEALTGHPLFDPLPEHPQEAWMRFRQRALERTSVDLSDAVFQNHPDLRAIILRSTARTSGDRFLRAKEMRSALSAIGLGSPSGGLPGTARPGSYSGGGEPLALPSLDPDPLTAPPRGPVAEQTQPAVPAGDEAPPPFIAGPPVRPPRRGYRRRAPLLFMTLLLALGAFVYADRLGPWIQTALQELGLEGLVRDPPPQPDLGTADPPTPRVPTATTLSAAIGPLPELRPSLSGAEELSVAAGRAGIWLRANEAAEQDLALLEQLHARGRALPEVFLSAFEEAMERGSPERAEAVVNDWLRCIPYLEIMGITDQEHAGQASVMGRRLGLFYLQRTMDDFSRRIPDRLDTPTELFITEQVMDELEGALNQAWDGLDTDEVADAVEALRAVVRERMIDFIDRLVSRSEDAAAEGRTDFDGRTLLRSVQNSYPSLVRLVVPEYVAANRTLDRLREAQQRFLTRVGLIEQLVATPLDSESAPERLDSAALTLRTITDDGSAGMQPETWEQEVAETRGSLTRRIEALIELRRDQVHRELDPVAPLEAQQQPLALLAWEAPSAIDLAKAFHQSAMEDTAHLHALHTRWADLRREMEAEAPAPGRFRDLWPEVDALARELKERPPSGPGTEELRAAVRNLLRAHIEEAARDAVRRYRSGTGGDAVREELMTLETTFTEALDLVREDYAEALAAVQRAREERLHADDFRPPVEDGTW